MKTSFGEWQKQKMMRATFGIDRRPASIQWSDIMQGPTAAEFRDHIRKLATFLETLK